PVVAGQETACHGAQHGTATRASLDQELIGDEPTVRGLAAAVGEPASRLPGGHVELRRVLAEGGADGAVGARLHLAVAHEPGVDPGPGGDGGPDLVRASWDFGLSALLEWVAHQDSSVSAAMVAVAAVGAVLAGTLGWTAITRWCSRPPSACSSWYFATSEVTASTSSLVKAARSAAEANRTRPSIANVASFFCVRVAPVIRSPTSRTSCAARAS